MVKRFMFRVTAFFAFVIMFWLGISFAQAEENALEIGYELTSGETVQTLGSDATTEEALESETIIVDEWSDGIEAQADGMANIGDEDAIDAMADAKTPSVLVLTHVQRQGWASTWVKDGATAGTVGKSLRMEALRLRIVDQGSTKGTIQYRSHVQRQGWQDWVTGDALSGSEGKGLRMEALQIRLTEELSQTYDVWYRVHAQRYGWMGWTKNGETAGTAGMGLRVEAIQVVLMQKDGPQPSSAGQNIAAPFEGTEEVRVAAHVQGTGWMSPVGNGKTAGTTGKSKRVEAIRAWLEGSRVPGYVETSVHVQREGWMGWVGDGQVAGTTGRGLRMEAIKMHLRGEAADAYDLYYRAHVQGAGWLAWAAEDEVAGSYGMALRVEAVQVLLVPQGGEAPSNADVEVVTAALAPLSVVYASCVDGTWQGAVANGADSGTTGKALSLEAFTAHLETDGTADGGGIAYRAHMQENGWMDWASDGGVAGLPDSKKRMEAIQIRLTGAASSMYDVWYRCHVQSYGWLGWALNGASAGTVGLSKRVEAIQIRLVSKGSGALPGPSIGSFVDGTLRMGLDAASGERSVAAFGGYAASGGAMSALNDAVKGLRNSGYDVGFIMMDLTSYKGVAYNCDALFYGASSIKAPYIASVAYQSPDAVSRFAHDITETLYYSWDYNYKQVFAAYGKGPMRTWCKESGARAAIAEQLPWADYSARDLAKMWVRSYQLYQTSSAGEQVGKWCERPNVSTIHTTLGSKYRTRSKGGWIDEGGVRYPNINGGHEYWRVSDDGGIVYAKNGTYVVAIMSSVPANHDALNKLTAAIDYAHGEM